MDSHSAEQNLNRKWHFILKKDLCRNKNRFQKFIPRRKRIKYTLKALDVFTEANLPNVLIFQYFKQKNFICRYALVYFKPGIKKHTLIVITKFFGEKK